MTQAFQITIVDLTTRPGSKVMIFQRHHYQPGSGQLFKPFSAVGGGAPQPPTYLVAALLASVLGWLTPLLTAAYSRKWPPYTPLLHHTPPQ